MKLRDYQIEAHDRIWNACTSREGGVLASLAVGAGKSVILASIIRSIREAAPSEKILLLAHRAELILQNSEKIRSFAPNISLGIFSAQLGERRFRDVTVAGIQSVYRKRLPAFGTVIVDECHLIGRNSNSMYGRLFSKLREETPDLRVIGLTGTPWRNDGSGSLLQGDDRLFEHLACDIGLRRLVDDGWLVPFVSKASSVEADLSQVAIRGGDYVAGEAEKAMDREDLVRAAVEEITRLGSDRRSWLLFAAGVKHGEHIVDELKRRGVSAAGVFGHTIGRDRILEQFKEGRIRALVNCEVLTTGFDSPQIDLIALLRPTRSPVLYTQILGRGSRPACRLDHLEDAEERKDAIAGSSKSTCLVLDYAGVIAELGPIDDVRPPRARRKGESVEDREREAPVKICPICRTCSHPSVKECPDCGHEFPEAPKHEPQAAVISVMSSKIPDPATTHAVMKTSYRRHVKKGIDEEGNDIESVSLRVAYWCGMAGEFCEWVAFGNPRAEGIVRRWWRLHCRQGFDQVPETVDEALERVGQLKEPRSVTVRREGKFFRVVQVIYEERMQPVVEEVSELELAGI